MKTVKQYVESRPAMRAVLAPVARAMRRIRPSRQQLLGKAYDQIFDAVEEGCLSVNVPGFCGTFEIDCHSDILKRILTDGNYEPELVELARSKIDPGKDTVDVGANIGLFTVLMAKIVSESSRILAFEPTPGALRHFRQNIERNRVASKVVLFEGVAAQEQGAFTLNTIIGLEEYSSLGKLVHPAIEGRSYVKLPVAGESIDRLVEVHGLRPGFIKIDAETAEREVLEGARRTILAHRPIILCESWPDGLLSAAGGVPGAVGKLLDSYGYSVEECAPFAILATPK